MYGQKRPFSREQLSDVNGPDEPTPTCEPEGTNSASDAPTLRTGLAPTLNRSECAILELWII
jgi:hypothetical protein